MKNEFLEYFKVIGIKEPIQARIEEILENFMKLCPGEEFIDVAVGEYLSLDGSRKYDSIRFYSNKMVAFAPDFLQKGEFVVSGLGKDFDSIRIEVKDYDFVKATPKSRLNIVGYYRGRGYTELKGTGENCDYLYGIYKKYFIPRLILPS